MLNVDGKFDGHYDGDVTCIQTFYNELRVITARETKVMFLLMFVWLWGDWCIPTCTWLCVDRGCGGVDRAACRQEGVVDRGCGCGQEGCTIPPPPPPDGHWSSRYASYRNAFLIVLKRLDRVSLMVYSHCLSPGPGQGQGRALALALVSLCNIFRTWQMGTRPILQVLKMFPLINTDSSWSLSRSLSRKETVWIHHYSSVTTTTRLLRKNNLLSE